jgi:hypothetical protein
MAGLWQLRKLASLGNSQREQPRPELRHTIIGVVEHFQVEDVVRVSNLAQQPLKAGPLALLLQVSA